MWRRVASELFPWRSAAHRGRRSLRVFSSLHTPASSTPMATPSLFNAFVEKEWRMRCRSPPGSSARRSRPSLRGGSALTWMLRLVHSAQSSPVVARKVIALYGRRSETQLMFADEEEDPPHLEFSYLRQVGGLPKKLHYEELKAATNNFQTPIGRGGSGSVFKGFLGDGLPVAVKRIEGELRAEFRSEITAIVSAQHVNLVKILGYCLVSGGHRFLVYEFIQNGSLDSWIFPGREEKEICLTWAMRYHVAIDVAKALAYLHHDCHSRILHLDVKPQNILLDENFRARVSDFGISRMMDRDESRVVTTVRGTRGYLAPEWFTGEGISEKSDVYSYGMVLLELVGGRRNSEFVDNDNFSERTWFYFPKSVNEKMREGKLMEIVDERLGWGSRRG